MKTNIYQAVTDRIIKELEKGVVPWHKPWGGSFLGCISHANGKPYSLLNQYLLGQRTGEWLTFGQIQAAEYVLHGSKENGFIHCKLGKGE